MKKIVILLTIFMLILSGCSKPEKSLNKYSNMDIDSGFNTYISLIAFTETQEEFDQYFEYTKEQFQYLNQLFDIYNDYPGVNNIKTINDNAGIKPVEVDPIIIDMINISKDFYDLSNHEFDITYGAVLSIWHEYRELDNGTLPSMEELEEASQYVGFDYIEIDEEKNTVYITNENVSLDVGGIAKGYAAEYIANGLEEKGLEHAIVDAGGNNRLINDKPDGSLWRVGIQNPNGNGSLLALSSNVNNSFVTSGDYQRFFVVDGKRYHHIIDPSTLFPADHYRSVTVLTDNSAIADALSTTLYTMPFEDGLQLLNDYNQNHGTQFEAVWVTEEDYIEYENKTNSNNLFLYYTDGLKDQVK